METSTSVPLIQRCLKAAAIVVGVALAAAACSGSSAIEASVQSTTEPAAPAAQPTEPPEVELAAVPTEVPVADPSAATESEPAAERPDDSADPEAAPVLVAADVDFTPPEPANPVDIDDIPEILQYHAAAYSDPSIDALEAAADLTGFPIGLRPPVEGPLVSVGAEIHAIEDGQIEVRWQYSIENAIATEYTLDADENLVGAPIDLITGTYPPYWTTLGLEQQNTATHTSLEHPSGKGSYQLYYRAPEPQELATAFGIGVLNSVGVATWGDVDINDTIDGENPQPGFFQYVNGDFDAAEVPVPLLAAFLDAIPTTAGMTLDRAGLATKIEEAGSSFAEFGERGLSVRITYEAPASDYDAVTSFYASRPFDAATVRYAKIDFFNPLVAEDREFDLAEDQASVDLVLSDTYPGRITMSAPDADDETFSVVVTFTLEPGRGPLT